MIHTHTITVAFVSPTPNDDWVNRLTARVSRHPFCHVELHFETVNKCFSILYGETARLRPKTAEYDACLQFCVAAETWQLTFDDVGMWRSWYGCGCCERSSRDLGRTFCSKIVTEALQYGDVAEAEHINPALATPSRIYEALRGSSRLICASVPYKRESLANHCIV